MPSIVKVISGDTAASLSLTALTRSDTGAAPTGVTLPIAFVSGSGGSWTATFTDPAPAPPHYNYTYTVTWPDTSVSGPYNDVTVTISPAGTWGTYSQLIAIYSADNINAWTTNRVTGLPDTTLQQAAFSRAGSDVAMEFTKLQYVVPPITHPMAGNLGWIEAELAGVYLYEANGLQDATKGMDGKMDQHRTHALGELQELLWLNRGGFTRITGYTDAPIGVSPTVGPNGEPVAATSPYPLVRWNGFMYVLG